MNKLKNFLASEAGHIIISSVLFLVVLIIVFFIYKLILNKLQKRAKKTKTSVDDFVIDLLRLPVLWLLFWIVFKVFTVYSFISKTSFYDLLAKISDILLILTIGWILIKVVRVIFYHFEHKLDASLNNNLNARTDLTKLKIFEGLVVAIITVVTISVCLMTFDKIRAIGVSLLTSAGIVGIIAGFAAQKSLGAVFAGIQIAMTHPIRLDDMVIVNGQSGQIEEINLTYVVVKLWDEKRLILPINYFMDNVFFNLSRNSDNTTGTVFLYVDYNIPVDFLRKQLNVLLVDHPKWDKRIGKIEVTDSNDKHVELRIALSSANSGDNGDLCVDIREKMISYINKEYPGYYAKTRLSYPIAQKSGTVN